MIKKRKRTRVKDGKKYNDSIEKRTKESLNISVQEHISELLKPNAVSNLNKLVDEHNSPNKKPMSYEQLKEKNMIDNINQGILEKEFNKANSDFKENLMQHIPHPERIVIRQYTHKNGTKGYRLYNINENKSLKDIVKAELEKELERTKKKQCYLENELHKLEKD